MPMFIDPNARIAVTDGTNTVFIKAKMDMATRAAVQNEIRASGIKSEQELEVHGIGAYRLALLHHNVVGWEGPDFEGCVFSRANLDRVDPTEPLWDLVADEIGKRNERKESPNPNSLEPTGSISDG